MKKFSGPILKLVLGISILMLVLQFVDLGEVLLALSRLQPEWIAASAACFVATRILMAIKWWGLLGGPAASVSYATVQRAICLSDYYGLLFPNTLAIDATRIILLRHSREGLSFMTAATLADRVINVAMAAIVSLLAMGILYASTGSLPFSAPAAKAVSGLSFLVLFASLLVASRPATRIAIKLLRAAERALPRFSVTQKVLMTFENVHHAMSMMLTHRSTLLPAVALAFLVVLVRVASVYFLFTAIGAPQPFLLNLALVPAIALIALLPISLFGLGLKDGAFVFLFGAAGVAPSLALGVSLTSYAVIIGSSLVLGVLASFVGPALPKAENPVLPEGK